MYGGLDKYGGQVVGEHDFNQEIILGQEAIETAGAEEILLGKATLPDGSLTDVMLCASIDPENGYLKWSPVEDESSAYRSVVSMSQMTSMLHDADRNHKYQLAIEAAVSCFIEREGFAPVVLDIGTGTGLLAMMAVQAGASMVYACEMFATMANIASEITHQNCGNKVKIIAKRSTDLTVGEDGDLPQRADILVTEIFDSALLGEGAVPTIMHARKELLKPASVIIPQRAQIFGQIIGCPQARAMCNVEGIQFWPDKGLKKDASQECEWEPPAFPVHVSALTPQPTFFSDMIDLATLDFLAPSIDESRIVSINAFESTQDGVADGALLHWELQLWDGIIYSSECGKENWQDHWLQTVLLFPKPLTLLCNESYWLTCGLTELDVLLRFTTEAPMYELHNHETKNDAEEQASRKKVKCSTLLDSFFSKEQCSCGVHLLLSPERVSQLSDTSRTDRFREAIALILGSSPGTKVCLDVNDGSFLGLMAASAGAAGVISLEKKDLSGLLFSQIAKHHEMDALHIWNGEGDWPFLTQTAAGYAPILADILLGEPYFYQMHNLILWQAINFWYLRTLYRVLLKQNATIMPCRGLIKGVVIELDSLHLSHGQVGNISGFDHSFLDTVQTGWHHNLFPYPMWQYRFQQLSEPVCLLSLAYTDEVQTVQNEVNIQIAKEGVFHALMIWVDFELSEGIWVSTFPDKDRSSCKQMLKFAETPRKCNVEDSRNMNEKCNITVGAIFDSCSGKIEFNIS